MHSSAATVTEYLASLPDNRRETLGLIREQVLARLPEVYEEAMNWGMITYQVPIETYPDTHNGQPLMLAALASQKNHMAIYLTTPYVNQDEAAELRTAFEAAGKKLDMGKSCIRFKSLNEIVLEPILDIIARTSVSEFVASAREARSDRAGRTGRSKSTQDT